MHLAHLVAGDALDGPLHVTVKYTGQSPSQRSVQYRLGSTLNGASVCELSTFHYEKMVHCLQQFHAEEPNNWKAHVMLNNRLLLLEDIHHHHQSLNREGHWGTTDDFTTSFLHFFFLFSTALWDLANSRPVYSLMLSSHLFLCLPCFLPPLTVPCKMVLARLDESETWPYHCSLRLFMMVRKSSYDPVACWILAWTFSNVGMACW